MLCDIELKKVEIDHNFYFAILRFFCPFCKTRATHKTKKYNSLKSLEYHLATEHKTGRTSQFTLIEIQKINRILALAMQLGIPDGQIPRKELSTIYPRVRRFEDEWK